MNNYDLIIKVYSDNAMKELIDSYTAHGFIEDLEYDIIDGEDWWQFYFDNAEEKFKSKWSKIFIQSLDGKSGRVLDRDYCDSGIVNNDNNYPCIDKLILIGKTSFVNLSTNFNGQFILSYQKDKIDLEKFYHKDSDENIMKLIYKIIKYSNNNCNVFDIIYNPNPQSIMMIKLIDHYDLIVHLPTRAKLNSLIGLERSLNFVSTIIDPLVTAERISKRYTTNHLDSILTLSDMLNLESDNSFYSIFKDEFCL